MGKKKNKKKDNTPRRKRYKRNQRLQVAKNWIPTYEGKNLVKGYAKWFGVDKLCAVKELEMLGYPSSESYKEKLKKTQQEKERQTLERKRKKQEEREEMMWEDSDEHFAFIAGDTSGGAAYGLTCEEWDMLFDDLREERVSDEEFYEQIHSDSITFAPFDLSQLDEKNIMIMDYDPLESLVKLEQSQSSDLAQLFEFFIQWKAGNLSAKDLRDILSEAVK